MDCTISLGPGEKLLVIPDIHTKHLIAEQIIDKEYPDKVLFLGDYFDSFGDNVEVAAETARWLKGSLDHENRTHLVGNHDLNYMTLNENTRCSGYAPDKHRAIIQQDVPWNRLVPFCWAGSWLFTHAGLSNRFLALYKESEPDSVRHVLARTWDDLNNIDDTDDAHEFLQAGQMRGGPLPVGSIFWCDYTEFEDIPDIRQMFGHTRSHEVRHQKSDNSEHYCIDTVLAHYAVLQDGVMTIRPSGYEDF